MLEKTVVTIKNRTTIDTIHRPKTNKANKDNFTTMNFWFGSFLLSSNPRSSERKSHQDLQAPGYQINWEIYTPYEITAGMLLHINGKFTVNFKSSLLSQCFLLNWPLLPNLRCISRYDLAVSVLSLISISIEEKRSENHQPTQQSMKLKDRASFYFFSRSSYMKSAQYEQTNVLSIRRARLVPQECRLSVEYKSTKHTKYVVSSIEMK